MRGEGTKRSSRRRGRLQAVITPPVTQRPATKELLVTTAEVLFGRLGFDAVSLREIAQAAGQGNTHVVQYHFKNKPGLIQAILDYRLEEMEALRGEWFQNLVGRKPPDVRELMKAFFLPTLSVRSHEGQHTFCRFLLQYRLQPIVDHPVYTVYNSSKALTDRIPNTMKIVRLLRERCHRLPQATFERRVKELGGMLLSTVVEHDNLRIFGKSKHCAELDLEPTFDIVVAAFAAPA